MTTLHRFEYMEWIEITEEGWELKKDAPPKVIKAFNDYNKLYYEVSHGK